LKDLFDAPSTQTADTERTLIVHAPIRGLPHGELDEFIMLAKSAGAEIIDVVTTARQTASSKTYIGSGKAEEIRARIVDEEIGLVMFNHELTPGQERNLEQLFECRVLDRNGLILDIFAQRAKTHEGKLQVELAQLEHMSTRLVRGWTHLERQKGGIGLRGPGETQLETDRRLLQVRVGQLKRRIDSVRKTRAQGRARRAKSDIPTVSLVGYTNAGKSTLFNRLTDAGVIARDQLFATLDPTLRRVNFAGVGQTVLVDTVGFVSHLPHELVESFKATLEETLEADLLLHVIDASSEHMVDQIRAVDEVLRDIGADAKLIRVFNKMDQVEGAVERLGSIDSDIPKVHVSALSGAGMEDLVAMIRSHFVKGIQRFDLSLPATAGKLRGELFTLGVVDSEESLEDGHMQLSITHGAEELSVLLGQHGIDPAEVLPAAQAAVILPKLEAFERPTAK
jgi:GTP-binding protein HflX